MVELVAKTPCAGLLPVTSGALTMTEILPERITSVMPFRGQTDAVSEMMRAELGFAFPDPGWMTSGKGGRAIWTGQGQAFVLDAVLPETVREHAALTDQSDGWAVIRVEGPDVEEVLARLTPLDLRPAKFGIGRTARTDLYHLMASITRVSDHGFDLMVMRAFARTAVHDLEIAMRSVTARNSVA